MTLPALCSTVCSYAATHQRIDDFNNRFDSHQAGQAGEGVTRSLCHSVTPLSELIIIFPDIS